MFPAISRDFLKPDYITSVYKLHKMERKFPITYAYSLGSIFKLSLIFRSYYYYPRGKYTNSSHRKSRNAVHSQLDLNWISLLN